MTRSYLKIWKLPIPIGYYISIQPHDGAMLGGGLSAGMFKVATSMIKDYILETSEEFEKIINHPDLCSWFLLCWWRII